MPGCFAAQDPAHPLDHLATGAAGTHHDAEVRVGHIDAFVEHTGRGDRIETAFTQVVEDVAAHPARRGAGDELDGHQWI